MKPRKQRFAASDKRKKSLIKVISIDLIFVMLTTVIISYIFPRILQSTVLGFSIFLIPNFLFTALVIKSNSVNRGNQMVRAFYAAEVSKFVVTAALFAFSFMVITAELNELAVLFSAYFAVWLLHQVLTYLLVVKSPVNLR